MHPQNIYLVIFFKVISSKEAQNSQNYWGQGAIRQTAEGKDKLQALAYEKQGYVTIARLATKFRGYRRVKSHAPPTK